MLFAQTLIEDGAARYQPGTEVPSTIAGWDDLIAQGAIGPNKPTLEVLVDTDGRVVAGAGGSRIARFDGDFTDKQINSPKVKTPMLGTHTSIEEHQNQEPLLYANDGGKGAA